MTHEKENTMDPNETHQNIAQQVDHMRPDHLRPGVDVGMEVRDESTLRILLPAKQCHVDVRYDAGPDTYTVTQYELARLGQATAIVQHEALSGIYCDQLGELIFGEDAKQWSQPFGGIVDMDTGETIAEF
jgi:hypothetical protein